MKAEAADEKRYFDYAASAPPFPEALVAQSEAARCWFGNPSAGHASGRAAALELRRLKAAFARGLDFADGRVVLMSGATEANNWVIRSVMARFPKARLLVAADVHASVWQTSRLFAERMDVLVPDRAGRVTPAALAAALKPDTRLFCCSHVANETGVIHDVAALSAVCEKRGVLCHVDGAQAVGHLPVRLSELCCAFYVFAAHKFGGPRGCGGVGLQWDGGIGWLAGGEQEDGLRAGTENLPGLAGAVAALDQSLALLPHEGVRLRVLACRLAEAVRAAAAACRVNGDPATGLPGLVSLSFAGLDGHALAADLDQQGFAVGTGSACSEARPEPSRALRALGLSLPEALGTVRISMGRLTHETSVGELAGALTATVRRHRRQGGV
ncbi:MAG: aminotransferase class V-fold PLP-dependent enzyme [bacterium]